MPVSSTDGPVVTEVTSEPADTAIATPSGDTTATTPVAAAPAKTMLETVQAALKPDAPPASKEPVPGDDPEDPLSKEKPPSEEDDKPSDEEKKNWSDRTQRRFQKLTSEVKSRDARIGALEPKASEYDKIDTFVRNAGLSENDVRQTLSLASKLRSDPQGAWDQLLPIMQHLERTVGNVLPAQLQQRVDAGFLTLEDAHALSRASASANLSAQRLGAMEQQRQSFDQRSQQQAALDGAVSEVEKWEARSKAKDPDWHNKVGEVQEIVELNIARQQRANPGWLPSAQQAVALSEDALKRVNERMKRFTPRPTDIRPINTGGPASDRTKAEPKKMIDVIRQTLAK